MRDMIRKGRKVIATGDQHYSRLRPERLARGEANGCSKLKEDEAIEILTLYRSGALSQRKLAAKFRVTRGAITGIIKGKNWKHIQTKVRSFNQ
jgi:DNA-binding MarR family transcriptional regulator